MAEEEALTRSGGRALDRPATRLKLGGKSEKKVTTRNKVNDRDSEVGWNGRAFCSTEQSEQNVCTSPPEIQVANYR